MSGFGIGLGIAQAFTQKKASEQQSDVLEIEADILRQEADREELVAGAEAEDFRRRESRLLAQSRAFRGASGVTSAGSPLRVDVATAAEIELGALNIINAGDVRATRLRQGATFQAFTAQQLQDTAQFGGAAAGGSTLLASGFFSNQGGTTQRSFVDRTEIDSETGRRKGQAGR